MLKNKGDEIYALSNKITLLQLYFPTDVTIIKVEPP